MPRRIAWREVAASVDAEDADTMLGDMKSFEVTKSNPMACTACSDVDPHQMRYRLLACNSEACYSAAVFACPWRGKTLTCLKSEEVSIYEFGEHASGVSSPKKKKLTSTQKDFCRELTNHHLRPMRIRNAMARKFETALEELPALSTVQNFVNHYSRTYLVNNDRVDDLRDWIHARAFTGEEPMTQAFTFGWDLDSDGKPTVGNGSDERPFVIGLTTKALIQRLTVPPESFILHVDATYKMNFREYPVFVVGMSDRSRGFHLVALFIVSQETQDVIQRALMALRRLHFWITSRELVVRYTMADADQAQLNALTAVFGGAGPLQTLMCFFHVMEKVHNAIRGFPSLVASAIVKDMYDLHFARTEAQFSDMRDHIVRKWRAQPFLWNFTQYMCGQWLFGRFSKWQLYDTPTGFASTNNPVETFNALLKRDYTLRRRLKMGALLMELKNCCEDQSSSGRPFRFDVVPPPTLTRRALEMERKGYMGMWNNTQLQNPGAEVSRILHVQSRLVDRINVVPNKRSEEAIAVSAQMGWNYARMEVEGQPWSGWVVDIDRKWCGCSYWFAFGCCIHVLYATRSLGYIDSTGNEVLVSRRKSKRKRQTVDALQGGRPLSVGPALTF
ncbi:hypothetical protein P3T76_007612 [Phytophthora citrophthora]|uniref:MULE transposase domain-containing protein n=1 Tax=Phytophthora citrophthora TaxID=4793 RepID=A0AAD9GN23_9STRA|nr:hypothetical protein P3T76_007612 [Phytophthora citrophthora]